MIVVKNYIENQNREKELKPRSTFLKCGCFAFSKSIYLSSFFPFM
jgi:hypothetical protein